MGGDGEGDVPREGREAEVRTRGEEGTGVEGYGVGSSGVVEAEVVDLMGEGVSG